MSWPTTPTSEAMEQLRADPSRFYTYGIYTKNISHDHFQPAKRFYAAAETVQRTAVASIGSGVIFGGFSAFMGMFAASAMANDPLKTPTVKETFKDLAKTIGTRFKGGFKSGLTIGAAFAFAEPVVESYLGHAPFAQGFAAGCLVGLRGGPLLTAASGFGFGAFSYLIEASGMREKMGF